MDSFVLCGEGYKEIRNSMRDCFFSGNFTELLSIHKV